MEILLIAISLAMDAFAVALCKGLEMKKINYKYSITLAILFGIFQAAMPLIGWALAKNFAKYITSFGNIVSFILLAFIGGKMIKESFEEDDEQGNCKFNFKEIIVLAIATSIDALAVGITFAFNKINLVYAISCIGSVAFILSFLGVIIGNRFGTKYKNRAEMFGGIVLVFLGCKFLIF